MEVTVGSSSIVLDADLTTRERIHNLFSFRDKAAEYQLARFIKKMEYWLAKGLWRDKHFGSEKEFLEWVKVKGEELRSKLDVFCCKTVNDQLILPVGLNQALLADLKAHHEIFTANDTRNFNLFRKNLSPSSMTLRPPQIDALRAMLLDPVGMLRMATGVGKTLVGQEIIRHYGVKSIFLVPSKPILNQTIARFTTAFGSSNVGKYGEGRKKHRHVTVATYQSVFHADPEDFDEYDLVIADECHHVPADTFYECVENKLRNAVYRYGLTADEERSDGGTILVEAATGPVVFSYEAPQAIKEGYLAQPTTIIYEITRTEGYFIKWITETHAGVESRVADGLIQAEAYTGEDSFPAYKNWIVGNDLLAEKVANLAAAFQEGEKGMSVLILIDEKETGDKLMRYLKPLGAELVTGETKNNEDVLARFNARKLRLVVATSTWGEGTDTPPVDVLVNLMGGTKTKQANGRALRNDVGEDGVARKPKCLIIDFDVPICPVLHRHSEMREAVHRTCGPVHRSQLI